MSKRRYFGTDGIRGRVGEAPITAEFVLKLGWAAGQVLRQHGRGKVLIGKDTRVSGYMFESALEAGLSAAGMDILLLGPMPTPAIAYLTRTFHAQAGIVISASHNPYPDNGIKFFGPGGHKLADATELAIEQQLDAPMTTVEAQALGRAARVPDAPGRYIEFCKRVFSGGEGLDGLHIVVDCAHGAAYQVAPAVFSELGAHVEVIGASPDGLNINAGVGSTHHETIGEAVRAAGADLGIALDGDGDRVLMVDHRGEVLDGDDLLYIIARERQREGVLRGGVVGTVMSNLGLEQALDGLGIPFERAAVGDRYVLERLMERDWVLGGESSGHIICLDRTTTGDGIITALEVLWALRHGSGRLADLRAGFTKLPQRLDNVRLPPGVDVLATGTVRQAVALAERRLGSRGRVLLRPSGTEPLLRVMVEGEDAALVEELVDDLMAAAQRAGG